MLAKIQKPNLLSGAAAFAIASSAMVGASPANAAEAPNESDQSAGYSADRGLSEIIVTAQKREQSLQDVPIAVTALTSDVLEANRVTTVADLSGLAPGLQVKQATGGINLPAFSMRGVVSYGVVPGSDKEISMYLDGVYISSPRGSIFNLPDVSRIEVLRGPQGTLFGRNSTAGAVSITTRDPQGDPHVKARFSVGNCGHYGFRLSADLPQVGPLSAYFSYAHDYTRGDIRNLGAGQVWYRSNSTNDPGPRKSPEYLGTTDQASYFGAIKFEPTDTFKVVYKIDHSTDNGTPDANVFLGYDATAPIPTLPYIGNLFTALLTDPINADKAMYQGVGRPEYAWNSFAAARNQKVTGHSVTATWQATDSLTVKNIFGYRKSSVFAPTSLDGISGVTFTQGAVVPYAQFIILGQLFSDPNFLTLPPAQQPAAIGAALAGTQQC